MQVERAEVGIGGVDAEFGELVHLFADKVPRLEKHCFGFFAIAVVLSCGGLLWKESFFLRGKGRFLPR